MNISKIQHNGMQLIKVDKNSAHKIITKISSTAHSMDILRKSSPIATFEHTSLSFFLFRTQNDRVNCINEINTHLDRLDKNLPTSEMFVRISPQKII